MQGILYNLIKKDLTTYNPPLSKTDVLIAVAYGFNKKRECQAFPFFTHYQNRLLFYDLVHLVYLLTYDS